MKRHKEFLDDDFGYCGTYHTHKEKKKAEDDEHKPFVRPKRNAKNLPDNHTDTKWLKKIRDKSWKTRCKKENQYDPHKKSRKEKENLGDYSDAMKDFLYRFGDGNFHKFNHHSYGFVTWEDRSFFEVIDILKENNAIEIIEDDIEFEFRTYSWNSPGEERINIRKEKKKVPIKFKIILDKVPNKCYIAQKG